VLPVFSVTDRLRIARLGYPGGPARANLLGVARSKRRKYGRINSNGPQEEQKPCRVNTQFATIPERRQPNSAGAAFESPGNTFLGDNHRDGNPLRALPGSDDLQSRRPLLVCGTTARPAAARSEGVPLSGVPAKRIGPNPAVTGAETEASLNRRISCRIAHQRRRAFCSLPASGI
jgi:hypothetical protein